MTMHLTEEQIHEALITESEPPHLDECAQCRAAVKELQTAIAGYRGATQLWIAGGIARTAAQPQRHRASTLRFALAATMMILLIVGVSLRLGVRNTTPASIDSAAQIARDNQLLSSIQHEISTDVPTPLQSLAVPEQESNNP